MAGKLGALPPTAAPRVRLAPFLTSDDPPPPYSVDWMTRVPDDAWGMLGNDRYGDCVWAGLAHLLMANAAYGLGETITFTDDAVLAAYTDVTGFDPDDLATDQGTVIQDALAYTQLDLGGVGGVDSGVGGDVVGDAVGVGEAGDRAHDLFGGLLNGFSVYAFAMTEFDQGRPWTQLPPESRGPLEGGHCVPTMKVAEGPHFHRCVTWGRPQPIGPRFWSRYFWESWAVITPEWVDANHNAPSGLDLPGLLDEVDRLLSA
jgi:hypothetical protein